MRHNTFNNTNSSLFNLYLCFTSFSSTYSLSTNIYHHPNLMICTKQEWAWSRLWLLRFSDAPFYLILWISALYISVPVTWILPTANGLVILQYCIHYHHHYFIFPYFAFCFILTLTIFFIWTHFYRYIFKHWSSLSHHYTWSFCTYLITFIYYYNICC